MRKQINRGISPQMHESDHHIIGTVIKKKHSQYGPTELQQQGMP